MNQTPHTTLSVQYTVKLNTHIFSSTSLTPFLSDVQVSLAAKGDMFKQLPLGSAVDLFLDGWSWTQQTSRARCKASGRGHQSQRPASADALLVARNGHRSDHYQGEEGKEKRTSVSPGCPQSCGSTIFFWPKNITLNLTVQEENTS